MGSRVAFRNFEGHPLEISVFIGLDFDYPGPGSGHTSSVQIIVNINPLISRKIIATDVNFLPGNSRAGGERDIGAILVLAQPAGP